MFPVTKTRSKAAILLDSAKYISVHARSLLISISALALPVIFTGIIVSFAVSGSFNSMNMIVHYKKSLSKNSFVLLIIACLVYTIGIGIYNFAINKHMLLTENEDKEDRASFNGVKKDFAQEFKNFAANFTILYVIYYITWHLVDYFFKAAEPLGEEYYNGFDAAVAYLFNYVLQFLPIIIIMPACLYLCIAASFVSSRDGIGASEALKKVWQYVRKNPAKVWLTSAMACMVLVLINYISSFIFYRIDFILGYASLYNDFAFYAVYFIRMAIMFITLMYVQVAVVFLYGSTEDEAEGLYIKNKIEKI